MVDDCEWTYRDSSVMIHDYSKSDGCWWSSISLFHAYQHWLMSHAAGLTGITVVSFGIFHWTECIDNEFTRTAFDITRWVVEVQKREEVRHYFGWTSNRISRSCHTAMFASCSLLAIGIGMPSLYFRWTYLFSSLRPWFEANLERSLLFCHL